MVINSILQLLPPGFPLDPRKSEQAMNKSVKSGDLLSGHFYTGQEQVCKTGQTVPPGINVIKSQNPK